MFAFSDRKGQGASPFAAFPSMSHNAIMAHSIRGRVTPQREGPRYCVACHLTDEGIANYGTEYDVQALAPEFVARWSGAEPSGELRLPTPNDFIPESLSMIGPGEHANAPRRVDSVDSLELWHATDTSLGTNQDVV